MEDHVELVDFAELVDTLMEIADSSCRLLMPLGPGVVDFELQAPMPGEKEKALGYIYDAISFLQSSQMEIEDQF